MVLNLRVFTVLSCDICVVRSIMKSLTLVLVETERHRTSATVNKSVSELETLWATSDDGKLLGTDTHYTAHGFCFCAVLKIRIQ